MSVSTKRAALIVGAMTISSSALAAGIDSHTYTCAGLRELVTAKGFIFINNSNFSDFVVADASLCGSGEQFVLLSVPTTDRAQCPVNYCGSSRSMGGMGGGGM